MEQLRLTLDATSSGPPPPGARRTRAVAVRNSVYEAAAQTRRTVGWRAPTVSPNRAVVPYLTTLRDRSRTAVRNDGYAKGAIEYLVSNVVGTGLKPLSQAVDPEIRKTLHALWLRWTDHSDADGVLDFYGQQAQATRAWLEAGECFLRLRPRDPDAARRAGLAVPLQVQVLEPELCPHLLDRVQPNGHRVRAGIERDRFGQRVAYHFHPSRPTDGDDFDASVLVRLPAERVIHLYDPLRPGQLRGLPHLTPGLVKFWELDKFDDAVLLRQQLANLFVAFLTRAEGAHEHEAEHPLTGLPTSGTDPDKPALLFEPGILQDLAPGEDVKFSTPPDAGAMYPAFMRQQLQSALTAAGVPYHAVTGDMSNLNDRVIRVILHDFRRRVQMMQHQIVAFQLCRRIWDAWLQAVYLAGEIPLPATFVDDPWPWAAVTWSPQGWPYLHPVQDVQAQREAIRAGLTSRQAVVSEHGEDAEAIDQAQADDNARADGLGLAYDSDGRKPRGAAASASTGDEADDATRQE